MEYAIYLLDDLIGRMREVDNLLLKNKRISRLYFGEEFCEELIPTLSKVKDVFQYAAERELGYTYLSGYLTDTGLSKQYKILRYLDQQKIKNKRIEVVVNDWGLLLMISKEFKNLDPVLGRMLTKLQRMPRYTLKQPISFSQLVVNRQLWNSQHKILKSSNLAFSEYRNFLKQYGIKRVDLDIVPQGIEISKDWGFHFSVYTPWSYVTGSRTCDLAGLIQPEKAKFITNKACSKPCKRFFVDFEVGKEMLPLIQRGNSIFFNNSTLASGFIQGRAFDRIILENLFFST